MRRRRRCCWRAIRSCAPCGSTAFRSSRCGLPGCPPGAICRWTAHRYEATQLAAGVSVTTRSAPGGGKKMPDQIAETIAPTTTTTGPDPVREELLAQAEAALALRLNRTDIAAAAFLRRWAAGLRTADLAAH